MSEATKVVSADAIPLKIPFTHGGLLSPGLGATGKHWKSYWSGSKQIQAWSVGGKPLVITVVEQSSP